MWLVGDVLHVTSPHRHFVVVQDYAGKLKVVKIDVDAAPQLVEKYKVYGLPYMVLFDKGEVLVKQEGAINRTKLEALLASKLPALAS